MATEPRFLCHFFTQGSCSFGDNCFYSHDPENSITVPPDSCWFYICTHCRFGDNCEKKHISKEEILRLNSSSKGDSPSKVISIEASKSSGDCQQQQQPNSANIPSVSAAEAAAAFKSYASAVGVDANSESVDNRLLCSSYLSQGYCNFPRCNNVHGDLCDLCGFYALHPFNEQLRQKHRDECMAEHERSMELAFAYQRSQDLVCGICFEIVIEKEPKHSSRFGILENCNHIYCVDCIRAWRNSNSSETSKSNKRVCPMCRIKSDFIIPSEYFYDDKEEEKQKLITRYKDALRNKHCKYFKRGEGKCPFGGACFYKHEYPDGRKADLPMPSEARNDPEYRHLLDDQLSFDSDNEDMVLMFLHERAILD